MTTTSTDSAWRTVHRVSFPIDNDPMTLPLYVDARETVINPGAEHLEARETKETTSRRDKDDGEQLTTSSAVRARLSGVGHYSATVPALSRVSFATYFNAFPAAYWRQWGTATTVRLRIEVEGNATIDVFRSTVSGSLNRIESTPVEDGVMSIDLPLKGFGDGGWLWFDVEAHDGPVTVVGADWQLPDEDARRNGTLTVAITTYNRPDDCVAQIRRFAAAPELIERLDRLVIVDQGSKRVKDADGYEEAAGLLGDKLLIVEQANLGGSGGFARGMYESLQAGESDYVMLLDDDVVVDTESFIRAMNFADYTRKPTLVGGHMLSLYDRSVLHSFGEKVNLYRSMWESVEPKLDQFNFAAKGLRSSLALHRRADVDFNGWWMCLIPRSVVEEIGLALPVFIKWDDCEYGLRARSHGVPTVSFPGAAVWHMPWTEKNDKLDWQAYYHQRNRWIVGLLYSPYRQGGGLWRESVFTDFKHLISLQYSAVAMRNQALKDLLSGPEHMHQTIGDRAAQMRALHASYSDGAVLSDVGEYPEVRPRMLPKGSGPSRPTNFFRTVRRTLTTTVRAALKKTDPAAPPETRIAAPDARWWLLATVDSALVSTSDGTGVTIYKRDRGQFRRLFRESIRLHLAVRREWRALAKDYRGSLASVVSPEQWKQTFDRTQP